MGLLSRLLGNRSAPSSGALQPTIFHGTETLEVVGESQCQAALWQIVGGFRRNPVRWPCQAVLLPEPDNGYDRNAIRVLVDGLLVGYLAREDAAVYLAGLHRLIATCESGCVGLEGVIVGGGPRDGRIGFLGVFLDHDPVDFGVAAHYTTGGRLRTGLSEALATDLDDDSYDLSWLRTLSADHETAVTQLRALLEGERDPIDRHYMLCELEIRLYRDRDAQASALDRFDEVCAEHHAEMAMLRPALLNKFGVVPVIEMYRQASIRCQKAKRWQEAGEWAQRGLDVYGEQAARPEVVEDLHKRAAHARTKAEEASRRKESRARPPAATTAPRVSESETLLCTSCGGSFERERTRGRKPKLCPTCRGETVPAASA